MKCKSIYKLFYKLKNKKYINEKCKTCMFFLNDYCCRRNFHVNENKKACIKWENKKFCNCKNKKGCKN